MSMKKLVLVLGIIAATCLGAATGHAASARTWVSNTGNDSNSCSVTQPCLTFSGALANTSSGGEIDCLTPGGFGAVTINISVTIDCEGVSNGGISVSSGNAITVSGSGPVNLIGLDINGENGELSQAGVYIGSNAAVHIRNCKIYGFPTDLGTGIEYLPTASGGALVVDNVFISGSFYGIEQGPESGVVANMTVRNSNISNNAIGILVNINQGTHAGATIEQTTLAFNSSFGLQAVSSGAVALIGNSTVVNNGTGVAAQLGGTIYSFKNNQIGGNGTDISGTITAYPGGLN
jgi:hypothetical protein